MYSYERIADTLRTRILEGTYRVGERIPSMSELEQDFAVSNITVRKALDQLRSEGLVAGRRGDGTRVISSPQPELVDIKVSGRFTEWFDSASASTYPIVQLVLGIDSVRCPMTVAAILGVDPDEQIWRMRRIRSMHGQPISYHVNYARAELQGLIVEKDLAGTGTFVELLRERYAEKLAVMEQRVEAGTANMDIADLLEMEFAAPIFFIENIYRTRAGIAAAVSHLYFRADRYCYSARIGIDESLEPATVNHKGGERK